MRTSSLQAIVGNGLIGIGGFAAGLLLASLAAGAALSATPDAAPAPPWTVSVIVYGNDACPASAGGEIVVCARQPESERYRIPKRFRGQKAKASPASNSWANKNETLEGASRTAAGLPDTCSAVGSGGQTGCYRAFLAEARAQKKADRAEAAGIP